MRAGGSEVRKVGKILFARRYLPRGIDEGQVLLGCELAYGLVHAPTLDRSDEVRAHSSQTLAKVYVSKVPMAAVEPLHDRVLPFYEEHG